MKFRSTNKYLNIAKGTTNTSRQKDKKCVAVYSGLNYCSVVAFAPDPGVQQKIYSWRCTNTKDINITPEYIWLCSTEF